MHHFEAEGALCGLPLERTSVLRLRPKAQGSIMFQMQENDPTEQKA